MPQIFLCGLNKTGSTSLTEAFSRAGYNCVHWDSGKLAKRMFANFSAGRPCLTGYETFEVISDPFYLDTQIYLNGAQLCHVVAAEYPNCLFIYLHREVTKQVESRLAHRKNWFFKSFSFRYSRVFPQDEIKRLLMAENESHRAMIEEFSSESTVKNRFLSINLTADSALSDLNDFLVRHGMRELKSIPRVNVSAERRL